MGQSQGRLTVDGRGPSVQENHGPRLARCAIAANSPATTASLRAAGARGDERDFDEKAPPVNGLASVTEEDGGEGLGINSGPPARGKDEVTHRRVRAPVGPTALRARKVPLSPPAGALMDVQIPPFRF